MSLDDVAPSYIFIASLHHNMVMEFIKKAEKLESLLKFSTYNELENFINYNRCVRASELYRKSEECVFFGPYHRFFSLCEIEKVYNGLQRTTVYDYEPLCFIRS